MEAQAAGLPVICSEAVPDEASVTEQAQTVELAAGAEAWAEVLLNAGLRGRLPDADNVVKLAGFDINDVAESVRKAFY